MSLFDDASLVLTPNGYKASKLYSVKPTSGLGDMVVTRNTTATRVNSAGLIESVAINVPRLDYPPLGGCPRILVEPERTNRVLYSEQFNNLLGWSTINATVNANVAVAPDNNTTADKFIPTLVNSVHFLLQSSLLPNAYTFSVFAKAGEETTFSMFLLVGTKKAVFNLSNGTVIFHSVDVTAKIDPYPNGWYRCSIYNASLATDVRIYGRDGTSFQGNNVNGFFIWGAQAEAASTATSYIPTTTLIAGVTRNADVISKTGISSLIGQTEGTIYAEIRVNKLLGTASRYVFHLSDGTANNRIYMAFSGASSNILRARIFNGGTLQCSIDSSTITATGTYKLALAYKNNDIAFYINGVQIGTATGTIPTCSQVDLGHNYAGASQLNDGINNANIWKTKLSFDQCIDLTN